jgi:hypothetical protein
METLRKLADGAPSVTVSSSKLAAAAQLTPKQAETGINGLVDASILTKAWDASRYSWCFTLPAEA